MFENRDRDCSSGRTFEISILTVAAHLLPEAGTNPCFQSAASCTTYCLVDERREKRMLDRGGRLSSKFRARTFRLLFRRQLVACSLLFSQYQHRYHIFVCPSEVTHMVYNAFSLRLWWYDPRSARLRVTLNDGLDICHLSARRGSLISQL